MILIALLLPAGAAPAGCGDTSTTGDADDGSSDETPADHVELDTAQEDAHDVIEDTAEEGDAPPFEGDREVFATSINRSCIGCNAVSWCGIPPISDNTGLTFDSAPNNDTGLLFAAERWEWHARQLEPDTCSTLLGDDADEVLDTIAGVTVLDAGAVTLSGDMGILDPALTLEYFDITHNYPSVVRLVDPDAGDGYAAGEAMHLDGAGGADVASFSVDATGTEPIEILSPSTDGDGKVRNIDPGEPLQITWSGGSDFEDVTIMLEIFYCPTDVTAFVMCRAQNDGAFTIPAEHLAGPDWPNVAVLYMSQSLKIPVEPEGLEPDAAWSVRSHAYLPVYLDPEASPPPFECDATTMAGGQAGNPCSDDGDCGGGCCLKEVMDVYFYENYCTIDDCEEGGDATCPDDSVCVANVHMSVPIDYFCAKLCDGDEDCRTPEYACLGTEEGPTVCKPNFW